MVDLKRDPNLENYPYMFLLVQDPVSNMLQRAQSLGSKGLESDS